MTTDDTQPNTVRLWRALVRWTRDRKNLDLLALALFGPGGRR